MTAQDLAQAVLRERDTFTEGLLYFLLELGDNCLEDLLAKRGTASTSCRSTRAFFELGQGTDAPVVYCVNNCSLGHSHASTNGVGVRQVRRIADVADKYQVRMVKITGSQRIDLLGVNKSDLPKIWADLGMPSGQAYTKGVRMVKTCVGTDFCRFGTQDSTSAGIELERRLENLYTPHKVKMGAVGCPRNCAEATVKDIGLVGQEGSWQVVVGGAAGKTVRKADLLITVAGTDEALEAAELFFQYYREHANYLERTYDFVERIGIEKVRKETVYATDMSKQGLLDRLRKSKALAKDAWLERNEPRTATQFVQITPMEVFA